MIYIPKKRVSSDQYFVKPILKWIGEQELEPDDFEKVILDFDNTSIYC
jgi:hypothetical protein